MKFSIFYRKEKVYSKNAPTVCLIIAVVLKAHKGRLKVFQQPVFHCSILCRGVHIKIIFNERGRENNLNQQFGSFFAYLFSVAYSPFLYKMPTTRCFCYSNGQAYLPTQKVIYLLSLFLNALLILVTKQKFTSHSAQRSCNSFPCFWTQ